jgi:hypothetical protein
MTSPETLKVPVRRVFAPSGMGNKCGEFEKGHPGIGEVEHVATQRHEEGGNRPSLEIRGEARCAAIRRGRPINVRTMRDGELDNFDGAAGDCVVQSAR